MQAEKIVSPRRRSTPVHRTTSPVRLGQLRDVPHVSAASKGTLQGIHLVQVEGSPAPGIDAGDLLRINFNCRSIQEDGFYAMERRNGSNGIWRFARGLQGLMVQDRSQWRVVDPEELAAFSVQGHVQAIYKSVGV